MVALTVLLSHVMRSTGVKIALHVRHTVELKCGLVVASYMESVYGTLKEELLEAAALTSKLAGHTLSTVHNFGMISVLKSCQVSFTRPLMNVH